MRQLPEQVGGMGVGVAGRCGAYAGVDADEDADQIGGERVGEEVGQVGVLGGRGVRRGRTLRLLFGRRGRCKGRGVFGGFAFEGSGSGGCPTCW